MPTPGMNDRHSLLKNLLRDTTLAMEVRKSSINLSGILLLTIHVTGIY